MNKSLEQVREFHSVFKHTIGDSSFCKEKIEIRQLRIRLLFEELKELSEASDCKATFSDLCYNNPPLKGNELKDGNSVDKTEELDALCDLQYVLNGKIITAGLHYVFDREFDKVHENNMSKAHRNYDHAQETIDFNNFQKGRLETYNVIETAASKVVVYKGGKVIKPYDHSKVSLSLD